MRKLLILRQIGIILVLAFCAGCSDRTFDLTPIHYEKANKLCESNGGIASIYEADRNKESKSCGWKCWAATGNVIYSLSAQCIDGATLSAQFLVKK